MRKWVAMAVLAALPACASAGRYGYARTYAALDAEEGWVARSEEPVYDELRRMPEHFAGRTLALFGVVTAVAAGEGGETRVTLQVRTHQERHLCEEESESTCRVTVSERDGGAFTAVVRLRPDEATGENRVQANGLLRVFGTVTAGEYDADGGPVLHVAYYRHWPRGQYVTTAASALMRR